MLYRNGIIEEKKIDFLFDTGIYNENIDFEEIATIEGFYKKHGYIPEKCIKNFLDWLTFRARKNISNPLEDITKSSFAGLCSRAQSFYYQIFQKLGLNCLTFNVGDVLGTPPLHALTCVEIPTNIDGEIVKKLFMLDPTFRQFCITEENRFERYNEEPRWAVRMSTPHPGYFFNLYDKGRDFAKNLIYYGYYEVNDENLKTYFDAFSLYTTPKESYLDSSYIGQISSTAVDGNSYWNKIIGSIKPPLTTENSFDLQTPREAIKKSDSKFLNRIRKRSVLNELDLMFEEEMRNGTSDVNNSTK